MCCATALGAAMIKECIATLLNIGTNEHKCSIGFMSAALSGQAFFVYAAFVAMFGLCTYSCCGLCSFECALLDNLSSFDPHCRLTDEPTKTNTKSLKASDKPILVCPCRQVDSRLYHHWGLKQLLRLVAAAAAILRIQTLRSVPRNRCKERRSHTLCHNTLPKLRI